MDSKFIITGKRKDANQNANEILQSATAVFAKKGFDATIEEVAQKANVGVGTVYRRFKNKKQLARAVANEVITEIYKEQTEIVQSNLSTIEKVQETFACYTKITEKYGQIHEMIVDLLVTHIGDEAFKETFLSNLKTLYTEIVIAGQKEGTFPAGNPNLYVIYLQNMINPYVVNQISKIIPLEHTPSFLAELALNGLLHENKIKNELFNK